MCRMDLKIKLNYILLKETYLKYKDIRSLRINGKKRRRSQANTDSGKSALVSYNKVDFKVKSISMDSIAKG